MIPSAWQFALLTLAAFRITRLVSYDDLPLIVAARDRILGTDWVQSTDPQLVVAPVYRRPLLAHLVGCPFCIGWWVSLAVFAGWFVSPRWTLVALSPFALSAVVGLIAKHLDP